MTKGDMAGVTMFGRPFKPVALGLCFSMTVLAIFNTADFGVLGDSSIGDVVSIMAGASAIMLVTGWVAGLQVMAEVGLLLAGLTMVLRSSFLFALEGLGAIGVWLGVGTAVVALGAFLLERTDENRGIWWPTKSSSPKV